MKVLILVVVLFNLIQCKPAGSIPNEKKQFKEVYINQFKLTYIELILLRAFNYSVEVKTLMEFDKSGFTEPILSKPDYLLIDSIVNLHNNQMVTDSANRIGRVAEGAEGKHVLQFLLDRIESKWLDSLATKRYKQSGLKTF